MTSKNIIKYNPPNISVDEALFFLNRDYGIDGKISLLSSYADQNFLVESTDRKKFIFKISNPADDFDFLIGQNKALHLFKKHGINCPKIYSDLSNNDIGQIKSSEKHVFNCRLLSYLEGNFYGEVKNIPDSFFADFGMNCGKISQALKNFHDPSLHRYLKWDLKHALDFLPLVNEIENIQKQRIVKHFLLRFEDEVIPILPSLRHSSLYNDANDFNVLMDETHQKFGGIIDMGDMTYSATIFESAVALSYVMMRRKNPVKTACTFLANYHRTFPLLEKEIDILFTLIATRLSVSVINSAKEQKLNPGNEYISISQKPAWDLLFEFVKTDPIVYINAFRAACGLKKITYAGKPKKELLEERKELLGKSLSVSYRNPLKIQRGQFQYLYDENGRPYLDTVNNVCHVGHCHPDIVKAGRKQMAQLNTNTRYLHDTIVEYAEKLTSKFSPGLDVCFFVNSGSEANELAMRMAKTFTGHQDFVVIDHAYHGNSNGCVDVSPYKFDGPGGHGKPEYIHKSLIPDLFRGLYRGDDPEACSKYVSKFDELVNNINLSGRRIAGFIHETVLSVGGQIVLPAGYLKSVYKIIRNAGGLCVADEVQTGFGRVGSHMWSFEIQDVVPDIITLGKPIGNGHPIGAVVTTKEIADQFANGMEYFNTFGGNPVSCAIGLEVLNVIERERLQHHAHELGEYFLKKLNELKDKHSLIGDVRGSGLFLGIELIKKTDTLEPASEEAFVIAEEMKNKGILISIDGPLHNVIKIKPPMVFTKENADDFVNTLDEILESLNR